MICICELTNFYKNMPNDIRKLVILDDYLASFFIYNSYNMFMFINKLNLKCRYGLATDLK